MFQIDNPDQRISEDIKYFTSVTLDFLIDTLYVILTVVSLVQFYGQYLKH